MTSIQTGPITKDSMEKAGCNLLGLLEQFQAQDGEASMTAAQALLWRNLTPYAVAMQTGINEAAIIASPVCRAIMARVTDARQIMWHDGLSTDQALTARLINEVGMPASAASGFVSLRDYFLCSMDIPLERMPFVAGASSLAVPA